MIKTSLTALAALAFAALSGCAVHITTTKDGDSASVRSPGSAKIECVASPSGECNYALFTSRCDSVEAADGKSTTTCTHQVFDQFKLSAGQSRQLTNLPSGYKQCMKSSGKPEVPSCA
jgi:curli biogenesis system outer membrane secretion channel CsgG